MIYVYRKLNNRSSVTVIDYIPGNKVVIVITTVVYVNTIPPGGVSLHHIHNIILPNSELLLFHLSPTKLYILTFYNSRACALGICKIKIFWAWLWLLLLEANPYYLPIIEQFENWKLWNVYSIMETCTLFAKFERNWQFATLHVCLVHSRINSVL